MIVINSGFSTVSYKSNILYYLIYYLFFGNRYFFAVYCTLLNNSYLGIYL